MLPDTLHITEPQILALPSHFGEHEALLSGHLSTPAVTRIQYRNANIGRAI